MASASSAVAGSRPVPRTSAPSTQRSGFSRPPVIPSNTLLPKARTLEPHLRYGLGFGFGNQGKKKKKSPVSGSTVASSRPVPLTSDSSTQHSGRTLQNPRAPAAIVSKLPPKSANHRRIKTCSSKLIPPTSSADHDRRTPTSLPPDDKPKTQHKECSPVPTIKLTAPATTPPLKLCASPQNLKPFEEATQVCYAAAHLRAGLPDGRHRRPKGELVTTGSVLEVEGAPPLAVAFSNWFPSPSKRVYSSRSLSSTRRKMWQEDYVVVDKENTQRSGPSGTAAGHDDVVELELEGEPPLTESAVDRLWSPSKSEYWLHAGLMAH